MYVATVPNRRSKPAVLLRESYREDGRVKNRTLANLSKLPPHAIDALRRVLRGETLVAPDEAFEIESSAQHGHVQAIMTAVRRLGLDRMISKQPCRERDLVLGMLAARIIAPSSKLETTRWWSGTSLPGTLGIQDADEEELYKAMDWLLDQQPLIEKRLASRHLKPGAFVLYDLTSTWVEGTTCPLAARGYSRDGQKDKLQINFGLLTDDEGHPISVSVYAGNTADPATVKDQVKKLKEDYGLEMVVFVGDRGMVTETQVEHFLDHDVEWITALKSGGIRKLKTEGSLQLGLFDDKNLFEFESEHYPGERLVACRNPDLATLRAKKRTALIDATKTEIEKIQRSVLRGRLVDRAEIGLRVGRIINKYKVAKHFKLEIAEGVLKYRVRSDRVRAEGALDGIYVIRTSVPEDYMSADDVVRHYKRLAHVERAFRSMKTVSLRVRPIYHRLENRVRAHIFLCMLAYYVERHMRRAWAPMLFAEERDQVPDRDPVVAAKPSLRAREKAASKTTADGLPAHSFSSLVAHLGGVVQNFCRRPGAPTTEPAFVMQTRLDAVQTRALELLAAL